MRHRLAAAVIVVNVFIIAGCSSGGTRTQSLSPSAPHTQGATTAAKPPASPTSSAETSSGNVRPIPTPKVIAPAQNAANAYVAVGNVLDVWGADPRKADGHQLAPYVTGAVLNQTVAIYRSIAKHGLAYRGTPDALNLKVVTSSSQSVIMSSCPTPNKDDPYVQYVVATGKPAATTPTSVLHPKAITVLFSGGSWRVSSIIPDEGRTCSA